MLFDDYVHSHTQAFQRLSNTDLLRALEEIRRTITNRGMLITVGNGGSASTASHAACDFAKGMSIKLGKEVRAISLVDSISTWTAWSNDLNYSEAFAKMLENISTSNDLLIAISGSGNSLNIINTVDAAQKKGMRTVGISGFDGGKLLSIVDFPIHVHSEDMQVVENLQLAIVHWFLKEI